MAISALAILTLRPHFPAMDNQPSDTPDPQVQQPKKKPFWRDIPRVPKNEYRSIEATPIPPTATIADRACRWLFPWDFYKYPGIKRGTVQLTGLSWSLIRAIRQGRRTISGDTARILSTLIRSRCAVGLAIAAELDVIAANDVDLRKVKRTGFVVVRDRGDGVARDARGRGAREW